MNAILQAIKSILRGIKSRLSEVEETAENAVVDARKAQVAVNRAQNTANNAQTMAEQQADWNENDADNVSYVKNRTHYKEDVEKTESASCSFTTTQTSNTIENEIIASALANDYAKVKVRGQLGTSTTWYNAVYQTHISGSNTIRYKLGGYNILEITFDTPQITIKNVVDMGAQRNVNLELAYDYTATEYHLLDKAYLPANLATVEQVEAVRTVAETAQATAENITKIAKIPNAADSAAGISAYSQCLNAYNRGDNLIYVRDNQEYEFNEYKSNCFYFRRYDPDALSFTYLKVKTTSVFSSTTYIQKMRGATASAYGLEGLVPAPSTGQHNMVLYGDATWRDPMIVCSSTEGSTKKFKIAVDDTGAITATEVTL